MFSTCQSLSKHCLKLQRLDLGSCCEITDLSLKALADGCPQLQHINISWCENITEKGEWMYITLNRHHYQIYLDNANMCCKITCSET